MYFKKYNSITNSYMGDFIEKVRALDYKGPWHISEKIHGANCQIAVSEEGIEIGGRNEVTNDKLWKEVLLKYEGKAKALFHSTNADRIILFGEFFGGAYPHPDVPRDKKARKVQKGVWYTPHNEVIFFDLYIEPRNDNPYYVHINSFRYLMDFFELPRVSYTRVSTLDEALAYPNDEPSEIYERYDLPQIEGNIREGIVIKPEQDLWIGHDRVIIKNKNDRFKEVWKEKRPIIDQKELTEKQTEAIEDMLRYVTENRALNVLSHLDISQGMKVLGPLIKEMNEDVIKDFEANNNIFNSMEKAEIKEVTKRINKKTSEICKKVLIEQLKG